MRNFLIIHIFAITISLPVFLADCRFDKSHIGQESNSIEYYDILGRERTGYEFDVNNLPIPDSTITKDLDQMYPGGPTFKWTFKPPLDKEFNGGKVRIDKIIQYTYYRTHIQHMNSPNGIHSEMHSLMEVISLYILLYNNVTIKYYIFHLVNEAQLPSGKLIPGLLNTSPIGKDGEPEPWPNYKNDIEIYWKQRGSVKQNPLGVLSWLESNNKWVKAVDPTPEEVQSMHNRYLFRIWLHELLFK